jgi:hypothetical protein
MACNVMCIVRSGFPAYSRTYMSTVWTVVQNTGARAGLVSGDVRKQLWRSLAMSRSEFFQLLPEGTLLDDRTLTTIEQILK